MPVFLAPASANPCRLATRSALALLTGAALLALAGCGRSPSWDLAYACSGQEQVSSYFTGDAQAVPVNKVHPNRVDFHVRSGKAFVKGYAAPIQGPEEAMSFGLKGESAWIQGQFDRRAGQLTLIEERTLDIQGRAQQVRTSGQYRCQAV